MGWWVVWCGVAAGLATEEGGGWALGKLQRQWHGVVVA